MDEEVDHCYEEFYEDVHTEFLKFGEIINFKVCRNGSFHLRGNVYVHYKSLESAVLAYNSINGRYFAGKQMTCEFVGVTRWKIAICGEYMKSKLKSCSHGTACNFIHCFRNPGGDYEWADWDNPPPKYWVKKMAALFGTSEELSSEKHGELEYMEYQKKSRRKTTESDRFHSRRFSSAEHQNSDSGGDGARQNRNSNRTRYSEFSNEKIRNHDDRRSRGKECSGSQRSKQSVPVNEGKLKFEKLGSGDRKHRSRRSSSSEMDHRNADSDGDFSDKNDGAHQHSSGMVAHYSGSEFSDQITKDQHDRHSRRKKHKRDFPDDKGRFKSEKLATGDGSDGEYTRIRYPNDRNEEESDFGGSVHAECRTSGYHSEDSLENSGNVRHGHRQRSGNSTGLRDRSRQRNNKVESEIEGLETGYSKWDKRESIKRSSQSSDHRSGHKRKKDSDDKHGEYSGRSRRESERSP